MTKTRLSTSPAAPPRTCLMRQAAGALALAACDPTAGSASDPSSPGATDDASASTTGAFACPLNDLWEPNDDADGPTRVTWDSVDEWSAYHEVADAYLCPGEDDWYRFDVAGLGYTTHYLYVRALVKEAGLCGAACDEPVLPPGPEHTMTIEVYRGDTREPLTAQTADDGVLALGGFGDEYAGVLLIRVYSPEATAGYPYRLGVNVRNYEGEDECEC